MKRVLLCVLLLGFVAPACSSGDDDGGRDPQAFCDALGDADNGAFLADIQPTDPADIERVLSQLHELEDLAPVEVEAEVEVLTDAFEQFSTALAAGGGDLGAIIDQLEDLQDTRELVTAGERVSEYAADECDFGLPTAS